MRLRTAACLYFLSTSSGSSGWSDVSFSYFIRAHEIYTASKFYALLFLSLLLSRRSRHNQGLQTSDHSTLGQLNSCDPVNVHSGNFTLEREGFRRYSSKDAIGIITHNLGVKLFISATVAQLSLAGTRYRQPTEAAWTISAPWISVSPRIFSATLPVLEYTIWNKEINSSLTPTSIIQAMTHHIKDHRHRRHD